MLRWFCHVYFRRVPVKTTLLRRAATIRLATPDALVDRATLLAKQTSVTPGRKLRFDSTCVQTTIHHPTVSGPLGGGLRVLGRLLRHAKLLTQTGLARVRDAFHSRMRAN